jgi:putative phosphoribosyl transferase
MKQPDENSIVIPLNKIKLSGNLFIPVNAQGIIIFAHGSGSGRHSPRNRYVASFLNQAGFATLLMDLLTAEEEVIDQETAYLRFNIPLLADRLLKTSKWLTHHPAVKNLKQGYFGASTGAGASIMAATQLPGKIAAIVSRGGRPDLAGAALASLAVPTLLIVGENDPVVIDLNQQAQAVLKGINHLEIVPGASHLFEEPGTLEAVATLASHWFKRYLIAR